MFTQNCISKNSMRKSFNRTATSYDNAADIQKIAGNTLLTYFSDKIPENSVLLDLGSGTGYLSKQLSPTHSHCRIIAADIAEQTLKHDFYQTVNNVIPVCADADSLPFTNNFFDIILANFVLQWSPYLSKTLHELKRTLKPQGKLVFSLPINNTFKELKSAWQNEDSAVHVNHFLAAQEIKQILQHHEFQNIKIDEKIYTLSYQNPKQFMRILNKLGCNNHNQNRHKGLTGKKTFQEFLRKLDNYRDINNQFIVTYEVLYVSCAKD